MSAFECSTMVADSLELIVEDLFFIDEFFRIE